MVQWISLFDNFQVNTTIRLATSEKAQNLSCLREKKYSTAENKKKSEFEYEYEFGESHLHRTTCFLLWLCKNMLITPHQGDNLSCIK